MRSCPSVGRPPPTADQSSAIRPLRSGDHHRPARAGLEVTIIKPGGGPEPQSQEVIVRRLRRRCPAQADLAVPIGSWPHTDKTRPTLHAGRARLWNPTPVSRRATNRRQAPPSSRAVRWTPSSVPTEVGPRRRSTPRSARRSYGTSCRRSRRGATMGGQSHRAATADCGVELPPSRRSNWTRAGPGHGGLLAEGRVLLGDLVRTRRSGAATPGGFIAPAPRQQDRPRARRRTILAPTISCFSPRHGAEGESSRAPWWSNSTAVYVLFDQHIP